MYLNKVLALYHKLEYIFLKYNYQSEEASNFEKFPIKD